MNLQKTYFNVVRMAADIQT